MSSAYHPQSDGQTEVLNRVIEQYLRAFVHRRPGTWGKLLPWVEWSHNPSWTASTGTSPYEITYGRKPFNFSEYIAGTSKIDAVDEILIDRDHTFQEIRKKLVKAQEQMKKYADNKCREIHYNPGDWVLLRLRPRRQTSAKGSLTSSGKLAKRYYGPFQVIERVGEVAYRLQLPAEEKIHSVFHCSCLKPFHRSPEQVDTSPLPQQFVGDQPMVTPLAILDYRRSPVDVNTWQVLVQWTGLSPDETTWEDWNQLREDYHLEDKVVLQGPRDDRPAETSKKETSATSSNTGVQKEEKSKRKIMRPSYLRDYA